MMKFDSSNGLLQEEISSYQPEVSRIHKMIHEKTGAGNDFLGWVDLGRDYDKEEFDRIEKLAEKLKGRFDTLVVCGIGGSYLGAAAAVDMIRGLLPEEGPKVYFAGNTFSSTYMTQLLKALQGKSVVLNVVSKSGTTTETALAFRMLREFMEKAYGKEECRWRIIVTTDAHKGTLKALADKEGYEEFVVPDDIGGRYSVLSAVGLVPMALAGIDIRTVMAGYQKATEELASDRLEENPAYRYAVCRRLLEKQGYHVEMLVTYEPQMRLVGEWWKQLFGESEGKDGKGILPDSATFSTDLHSMGQFIQQGSKVLYETILNVEKPTENLTIPNDPENNDQMNYLSGRDLDWVNKMAQQGTLEAHVEDGKVPNLVISLPDMSAFSFGYMCYFFFIACAMSCYMLEINPFNQPGVEIYKRRMFHLLGKPGFEK
jgi:glucose-6-phosphate isomerase